MEWTEFSEVWGVAGETKRLWSWVRPKTETRREHKASMFPESEMMDLVLDTTTNTNINSGGLLGRIILLPCKAH